MPKIRGHRAIIRNLGRLGSGAEERPDQAAYKPPPCDGSVIIRSSAATDKGGCGVGGKACMAIGKTRRPGDKETGRNLRLTGSALSPCLLVSLSFSAPTPPFT